MSSPGTPKIDELKARLASDPGSRMFFPLAEELRKAGEVSEAERVLRSGIERHPAYLSAWVSLGRLLSQQERHSEAVEALNRALQLDPENVVAARLAAESYLAIGDKVEAIKKFKLVHAFIPSDLEIQASIETLERQLNPEKYIRPINVTEEIPEFRNVAIGSQMPAEGESESRVSDSAVPGGEASEVNAPVGDPFDGSEGESTREIDQFSPEGSQAEDRSPPANSGPMLSIVRDPDEQRQKTIEKLHRWLTLIQRNQRRE